MQRATVAEADCFVFRQAPADVGGANEQADGGDQGQQDQMGEVVARMRFFFLANIRPREVRLSEQFDDRCGHDDLQVSKGPPGRAHEEWSAGGLARFHF
ncbi:hypothetical protein D3C75_1180900 [compost metagenome]